MLVEIKRVSWEDEKEEEYVDGVGFFGFCVALKGEVVLQVYGYDEDHLSVEGEHVCYLEGIERAIRFDPDLVLLPSRLNSEVWRGALSAALER